MLHWDIFKVMNSRSFARRELLRHKLVDGKFLWPALLSCYLFFAPALFLEEETIVYSDNLSIPTTLSFLKTFDRLALLFVLSPFCDDISP